MDTIEIWLFGKLTIRLANGDEISLTTPRVQELFCYLLLRHDHAHSRELLFDLFWRNSSLAQARRNLRQTLWQLQSTFDAGASRSDVRLIRACTTSVQINPDAVLQTDVASFKQAFTAVNHVPGDNMTSQQAKTLQAAVELDPGIGRSAVAALARAVGAL